MLETAFKFRDLTCTNLLMSSSTDNVEFVVGEKVGYLFTPGLFGGKLFSAGNRGFDVGARTG